MSTTIAINKFRIMQRYENTNHSELRLANGMIAANGATPQCRSAADGIPFNIRIDVHKNDVGKFREGYWIPFVTGERRKAKNEQPENKKKYKKKNANSARLCADDVMARNKPKAYQDSYAEIMNKYGLQRGIDGSEAKHIST